MPIIIDVFPFFTTLTLLNFNINFSNGEFPLAVEKCYQTSTSFRQVLKKTDFYNFRGKDGSTIYYIQWDIIQSLDFSWKSCHGYFVYYELYQITESEYKFTVHVKSFDIFSLVMSYTALVMSYYILSCTVLSRQRSEK